MATTIKLELETKERMLKLDLAEKGKSFNVILTELIYFYEKNSRYHQKAVKEHEKQLKEKLSIMSQRKVLKEITNAKVVST